MRDEIMKLKQLLESKKFNVDFKEDTYMGEEVYVLDANKGKIIKTRMSFVFVHIKNVSPEELKAYVKNIASNTFIVYICYVDELYDKLFVDGTTDLKYIYMSDDRDNFSIAVDEYIYVDEKNEKNMYEKDFHIAESKYVNMLLDILKEKYL